MCAVVVGFTVASVTREEGSTSRPIDVTVRAGVSITGRVRIEGEFPGEFFSIDGDIVFNDMSEVRSQCTCIANSFCILDIVTYVYKILVFCCTLFLTCHI